MAHALLFDRAEWLRLGGPARDPNAPTLRWNGDRPPVPASLRPVAILPTWSDADRVNDLHPGKYVIVEIYYDRAFASPTYAGVTDFLEKEGGHG